MTEPLVPEHLVGERIGGRFVIERLIGSGPVSVAFRATDDLLQRRVTVKLFHPDHPDDVAIVDQQLELAKAVARLSHPNIVTVIDRGEHEGMPFVVLEHVRGENLQERIDRFAPLAVGDVVGWGRSIARALAYAHAQGVVHGNLRPGNVLLDEDGDVKLVDFGGGSYLASLTGADPYLSPERRLGDTPHDELGPEEDLFALGVLVFVALTEQDPAPGITAADVQMLRPDASPRLAAVIARAVSEAPESRPTSMQEFAAELGAARPSAGVQPALAGGDATASHDQLVDQWDPDPALEPLRPPVPGRDGARRHDLEGGSTTGATQVMAVGTADQRRRRSSPRATRARIVGWSMLLLPLAALVLVGVLVAGERSTDSRGGGTTATPIGDSLPVPLDKAGTFDPYGDEVEHEEEAPWLIDGDPDTAWQTEGYETGLGKDGVGFWVRSERPVEASGLRLTTDLQGWGYSVYGAMKPAESLDGWTRVSKEAAAENGVTTAIDTRGESYQYWLVWIDRLSLDTDDTNKLRARAAEVKLLAPGG